MGPATEYFVVQLLYVSSNFDINMPVERRKGYISRSLLNFGFQILSPFVTIPNVSCVERRRPLVYLDFNSIYLSAVCSAGWFPSLLISADACSFSDIPFYRAGRVFHGLSMYKVIKRVVRSDPASGEAGVEAMVAKLLICGRGLIRKILKVMMPM